MFGPDSEEFLEALATMQIPDPICRTCERQLPEDCFQPHGDGRVTRYKSCRDCRYEPECTECGNIITLRETRRANPQGRVEFPFLRGVRYQCEECIPLELRDPAQVALQLPNKIHRADANPWYLKEELERRCKWVVSRERGVREREEALRAAKAEVAALRAELPHGAQACKAGRAWAASARKRIADYGFDSEVREFTKAEMVERQGSESCAICEATDDLVLDHVHPIAAGGPHTLDNARLLCAPCNGWKVAEIDRPLIEARRGELRRAQLATA